MKIKTVTIVSLAVVIMIALVAVFINFSLVPKALTFAKYNRELENKVAVSMITMNLPMNVLISIVEQSQSSENPQDTLKFVETFNENALIISRLSEQVNKDLYALKASLEDMNTFSLNRHSVDLQKSAKEIDSLMESSNKMGQMTFEDIQNPKTIEAIEAEYANMTLVVNQIVNSNKMINDRVVGDMTMLLNIMFILLFIALGILGTGVLRFVQYQLPYIVDSLNAINNHEFERYEASAIKPFFEEEKAIHRQIDGIVDENQFIEDVRELLLGTYLMDDAMEALYRLLLVPFDINRIGIAFVDYDKQKIIAQYGIADYGNVLLGPGYEIDIEETTLKTFFKTRKAKITRDLEAELAERPDSVTLKLLIQEGIRSNMILPMTMGSGVFGFLFLSSKEKNHFNDNMLHLAEKLVYEIKGLLNRAYFTKVIFAKVTNSFSELVDQKDNETGDHIHRMVNYSILLAKRLMKQPIEGYEVNQKFILELEENASSHDIGKVGIPDNILKKPGKLTPEEWHVMKTHSAIGANIFNSLREGLKLFDPDFYRMAEDITRYHHEKWDGSGYPNGLKGSEIQLSARIVAIADVFDALTSKRVYKEAFHLDQTLSIIRESSGSHLDPHLVELFLGDLDEVLAIMNGTVQKI